MTQRIVLAYSGGDRSSAAIAWLADSYDADVVALTLDIGQGGDLEEVRDRALALGAIRAHVLDVRDVYARHYLIPALKADALYDGRRSRANALSRPLIAQKLVEIAAIEETTVVAHGSPAADSRITVAARALNPAVDVLTLPSDPSDFMRPRRVTADRSAAKSPIDCPDEPALVEVTFTGGVPTAINAVAMPLVDLVGSLDIIAGAHGVGGSDGLESPAATVLQAAHKELQTLTITGEADAFSLSVSRQLADIIDRGSWFTPLAESLVAYVDKIQERVSGTIRLELFKGRCTIVDRRIAVPGAVPAVLVAQPFRAAQRGGPRQA